MKQWVMCSGETRQTGDQQYARPLCLRGGPVNLWNNGSCAVVRHGKQVKSNTLDISTFEEAPSPYETMGHVQW